MLTGRSLGELSLYVAYDAVGKQAGDQHGYYSGPSNRTRMRIRTSSLADLYTQLKTIPKLHSLDVAIEAESQALLVAAT